MRILLVSHTASTWTPYFARYFALRGWTVKVVSFSPEPIDGVDVAFVGVSPFDKTKNKHVYVTRVTLVRRIAKQFRPDVTFAPYLSSNGLTAALAGLSPLVTAAVGSDVMNNAERRGIRLFLRRRSISFVCRRSQLINTVSQELTDELVNLGVPASKIIQLPFGADTEAFRPAPGMPREVARQFICTRRHERIYDNETIIRGLARLRSAGLEFRCTFVGDGSLSESLRRHAESLGLGDCVSFVGVRPHGELPELLRHADLYISASLRDGTSVSLLEAMAAGLVPVVSRIAANLPWVRHGENGLLFDCGDADSLARCLEQAMLDTSLRRRALEMNRNRVEREGSMKSHLERMAESMEQIASR